MSHTIEPTDQPKRFTLLYQLFLTNQAARRFMRSSLAGTGLSGEEYALLSYLYGNGPRTLSQAARDFGLALTTVATMVAPLFEAGELERRPHPTDRRARLIALTDLGQARLERALPAFTEAYRGMVAELEVVGVDPESIFTALERLRAAVAVSAERLEARDSRSA